MKQSLKSSDLKKMSPDEQDEALRSLVKVARGGPNGDLRDLGMQIHAFELKYRLSSNELRHELAQGKLKESWEVCQWLLLINQRDLLTGRSTN